MIREKIISLIPSKTMREYLMEDTDRLDLRQYFQILTDLCIPIHEKRKLADELLNECGRLIGK